MNPCKQTGPTLQRDAAARPGGQGSLRAPSPGSPAWSDGAFAAQTPSNRPRIVLEPSRKDPASFPEGSRKDPARIRRGLGASGTPRSGRSAGSPPGAPAHRPARRPRQGRRLGLTALPPPRRPRIAPKGSGQLPRRIRPASPTARTTPTPPGGRPWGRRPAGQNQPPLISRVAA
jgi:hypothetical protein